MTFEYKVVPAPTRGRKARGVKTPADRFARALEAAINDLAAEGWEYLRTDTLPAEERQGLTGRTTVYQNMLVFRRAVATAQAQSDDATKAPAPPVAVTAPVPEPAQDPAAGPSPADGSGETARHTGPDAPARRPAEALDRLIAEELAAPRAPRLPSAGAAQKAPGTPVKAPAVGGDRTGGDRTGGDRTGLAAE